MKRSRLEWPSRLRQWRKPALVGASVLLHAVVLAWLGLSTFSLDLPTRPDQPAIIQLELEPRPLLKGETARVPSPAARRPDDTAPLMTTTNLPRTARLRPEDEDRPTAPQPRVSLPAPGTAGSPAVAADGAWRVRPNSLSDQASRALRTSGVGCTHREVLSERERDICDQRLVDRAASAPPIRGTDNPARDAQFAREGARALAQYEARRRPLAGGTGNAGPADCVGSNFGAGCAGAHLDPSLQPYATGPVRTRRDGAVAGDTPIIPGASRPRD